MPEEQVIKYEIKDPVECNLSFIPFINHGGMFIPTSNSYSLGEHVLVDLLLPGKLNPLRIEGKVIWLTPQNALHYTLPGIGIQFISKDAATVKSTIEAQIDNNKEVGGYTYGTSETPIIK